MVRTFDSWIFGDFGICSRKVGGKRCSSNLVLRCPFFFGNVFFVLDLFVVGDFFTDYTMVHHHEKPPFGGICLDCFFSEASHMQTQVFLLVAKEN